MRSRDMWHLWTLLALLLAGCMIGLLAYLLTRLVRILVDIRKKRKSSRFNFKRRKHAMKTMIVAGSGGHTTEMMRLVSCLGENYSPRHYVLASTDKMSEERIHKTELMLNSKQTQYELHYVPRSREVLQSWISSIVSTLHSSAYCFPLMFRSKPDLVLCNGPGTCVPICAAAFILTVLGIKRVFIVYVESICRVKTLSLSGRLLYYIADHFLVQWPELRDSYPLSRYIGRVV